jgi:hypothetical protein
MNYIYNSLSFGGRLHIIPCYLGVDYIYNSLLFGDGLHRITYEYVVIWDIMGLGRRHLFLYCFLFIYMDIIPYHLRMDYIGIFCC